MMILIIAIVVFFICAIISYVIMRRDFARTAVAVPHIISLCRENIGGYPNGKNNLQERNDEFVGGVGTRGTARGQSGMVVLPSELNLIAEFLNSSESRF